MQAGRADRTWVSGATVDWVLAAASGVGCNTPQLLWQAGIQRPGEDEGLSNRPLLATEFTPVLQACLKELRVCARGVDARIAALDYAPLLSSCLINSPTLHEAACQTLQFIQAVQGPRIQALLDTSSSLVSFCLPASLCADSTAALVVDFFELASYYKLFSLLIGEPLRGQISLAHPPVAETAALKGALDCPIRFGGRDNCITFEARMLRRPVCLSYAQLEQLLHSCAVALLQPPGQQISARLEMLIRRALEASAPVAYADQIARQYGKSGPTLRRQLVQEGTTFRGLLNKCRLERAAQLLSETNLTVEQIAHRLSFSTASGFSRAFKGWTGVAPAVYRKPRESVELS